MRQQQWKRSGKKRKDRVKLRKQNRFDGFLECHLVMYFLSNVLFLQVVFESHLVYDQTQGIWWCLFLTLQITLLC
jgi:hypothetical protein